MENLAHANGFVFLVFAYCTRKVYLGDQVCRDPENQEFLDWVFYGNLFIYSFLAIFVVLHIIGKLEKILTMCGAVCVTIQFFLLYIGVYLFNFLTMIYGIWRYFFNEPSPCKELLLFNMVLSYIFAVWFGFLCYTAALFISNYYGLNSGQRLS